MGNKYSDDRLEIKPDGLSDDNMKKAVNFFIASKFVPKIKQTTTIETMQKLHLAIQTLKRQEPDTDDDIFHLEHYKRSVARQQVQANKDLTEKQINKADY